MTKERGEWPPEAVDLIGRQRGEIERLTRERDEWAEKWHATRKLYAELKYPGMTGVVRPAEQQVEPEPHKP